MKIAVENTFHRIAVCLLLVIIPIILQADDGYILNRKVKITKNKETVYQLLKLVSDQTGYLFIYDSQLINNDKVVKIRKGEYTIREAIYTITGNDKLEITIIRNHILLKIPSAITSNITVASKDTLVSANNLISLGGIVYDKINNEPIAYCAIGVNNSTIGTISNQNGEFRLTLPDSLTKSLIKLSHIGYLNEEIEISLLAGQTVRISLEPKVVPLQEIIVRTVNPWDVLKNMMENRKKNYPSSPAYITTFYREGIEHKKKVISLTEAILKIYKTGYQNATSDQVKLVKMRNILSKQESDTIFTKMKSGVNTCLLLDVMKVLPDFLIEQSKEESPYIFTHTDISVMDNRRVNVISFEQKKEINLPLYRGDLFIDTDNQALLEVRFEVNPEYAAKATPQYILRKAKDINLTLQKAHYTISYKPSTDGIYYANHIRGDIDFKVKRKRRLFTTSLHVWFEMVNCEISTENVKGFARSERLSPHNIFSDTNYGYDPDFWKNFNIILPEDKLEDMIINNINKVVESQIKN